MNTHSPPRSTRQTLLALTGRAVEVIIVIVAVVVSLHWFVTPLQAQVQQILSIRAQSSADALDLYQRAVTLYDAGDTAGTLALLSYAFDLSSTPTAAMYGLRATAQHARGEVDTAITDYQQALALNPGNLAWHQQVCSLTVQRGQFARADEACSRGLQVAPDDFTLLNTRCYVRAYHLGQPSAAVPDCTAASRAQPEHPYPYNNRAQAQLTLNNYGQAIDDATSALQRGHPMPHLPYSTRAHAHLSLNNLEAAFDDYQAALAHQAEYAPAHRGLAQVYDAAGQPDAARGAYCAYRSYAPSIDAPTQQRIDELGGCDA